MRSILEPTNIKTFLALAALGLSLPLAGCGESTECGDGTEDKDGTCVAKVDTTKKIECGANTTLKEGKCVANEVDGKLVCGDGTSAKDGKCVPDNVDGKLICGDGTEAKEGKCVPTGGSEITCGTNTVAKEGKCIIEPTVCGGSSMLDPQTNTCIQVDGMNACGNGTALDAGTLKCVPTDQVCGDGTTFNAGTGLCLSDVSCSSGDSVVDGVCLTPAEKLAKEADYISKESEDPIANNDSRSFGGEFVQTMLPPMGESYIAVGEIHTPVDVNQDGKISKLDQDFDYFTFDGKAGQVISISVQALDEGAMGITLFGLFGDFGRFSGFLEKGLGYRGTPASQGSKDAVLKLVLPFDGSYFMAINPADFSVSGEEYVVGGNWRYVMELKVQPPVTSKDLDISSGKVTVTGDVDAFDQNVYTLTKTPASAQFMEVHVEELGNGVDYVYTQFFDGSTDKLLRSYRSEVGDRFPVLKGSADTILAVDSRKSIGFLTDYKINVKAVTAEEVGDLNPGQAILRNNPVGLKAGEMKYHIVDLPETSVLTGNLLITNEPPEDAQVNLIIYDFETMKPMYIFDNEEGNQTIGRKPMSPGKYVFGIHAIDDNPKGYEFILNVEPGPPTNNGTDTCDATNLIGPGIYAGSNANATNDYSEGVLRDKCTGWKTEGPDTTYAVNVPAGQTLSATLTSDSDLEIYLVSDCSMIATSCLVGRDSWIFYSRDNSIEYVNETGADQQLFLIVDAYDTNFKDDYFLSLDIEAVTP